MGHFSNTGRRSALGNKGFFSGPPPVSVAADWVFTAGDGGGGFIGFQEGGIGAEISGGLIVTPNNGTHPFLFADDFNSVNTLTILFSCTVTPASFTSITIVELSLTLTSAGAVFSPGCGLNQFQWTPRAGLASGTTYHVNLTP